MTIKQWLLIVILTCFTVSCGVIQELPEYDNGLTTTYTLLHDKIHYLDNVSLLADGGVPEREIVPSYNQIHRTIKDELTAGIKHICLLGVLDLESDLNSYPINGRYSIELDSKTINHLGETCGITSFKVSDNITVSVSDYVGETSDFLYDKTISLDLSLDPTQVYHIRYGNEAINIAMIKKETVVTPADKTLRMLLNYDLNSNILRTEVIKLLDDVTNKVSFYRILIEPVLTYVTFFDNLENHLSFTGTSSTLTYEKSANKKSWYEAQGSCKLKGGTLASIFSLETNQYLKTLCFGPDGEFDDDCWIGLNDIDDESTFYWADKSSYSGKPYTYELESLAWDKNLRDCFHLEGFYQDITIEGSSCAFSKKYICEYEKSELALSFARLNPSNFEIQVEQNSCLNQETGVIYQDKKFPCSTAGQSAANNTDLLRELLISTIPTSWEESIKVLTFNKDSIVSEPIFD